MKVLQNRSSQKINGIFPGHCVEATSEQALELELAGLSPLESGDTIPDKIFNLQDYDSKAAAWELQKELQAKQEAERLALEAAEQAAVAEKNRVAEEEAQRIKLEQELSTKLAVGVTPKEFYKKNPSKRISSESQPGLPSEFSSIVEKSEPHAIENKKPLEIKTTAKKKV